MFKRKKDNKLYLSDRQPLNTVGKILLALSYIIMIVWSFIIVWPLSVMVISSFNGNQGRNISLSGDYVFSLKNFQYLFDKTYFAKWVGNTIYIAIATALITLIIVSFTGYAYSRFRFKGKRLSLMGIMLIQTIPTFAGITAFYAIHSIISGILPVFSRKAMLILIYAAGGIASNTFILKGYIDSVSTELDDAARIDGCSNMEVYRLIYLKKILKEEKND